MATARKKPVAKKPTAKKPAPKAKPKSATVKTAIATRRPDPNQPPTVNLVNSITQDVLYLITELSNYAANLRALDRQRHNGVGLRRLGFIEAAFRLSSKFPQYFPHWLNTAKFQADLDLFNAIRSLVEVCRSLGHGIHRRPRILFAGAGRRPAQNRLRRKHLQRTARIFQKHGTA